MVVEHEGVELDHCVECDGTWFDRDELELLFEGLGPEAHRLLPAHIEALPDAATQEKPRRCPACGRKMRKVLLGIEKTVLIDACPRGDGLWFDSTEVAQLAEDLAQRVPAVAGRAITFMGQVFKGKKAPVQEEGETK